MDWRTSILAGACFWGVACGGGPTSSRVLDAAPEVDGATVEPASDGGTGGEPQADALPVRDAGPPDDAGADASGTDAAVTPPATDDGEWPDPAWAPRPDAGEPPPARYGEMSEAVVTANRERYGRDNISKSIMQLGDSLSESWAFLWTFRFEPYAPSGISDEEGYFHVAKEVGTLSGQTSGWGRSIADEAVAAGRAELTTILFGTNDLIMRVYDDATYRANLEYIVDRCLARGTLPLLMTLPPLMGSTEAVAEANAVVRAVARARSLPVFDFMQVVVDLGNLDRDMPDGVHPTREAYDTINTEWIRFYKLIEHRILAPERAARGDVDPVAADQALTWRRVLDQDFSTATDLVEWERKAGDWSVVDGRLRGTAPADGAAILLAPVRVTGPVRVEVIAESDGAEISVLTHNEADDAGVRGWYFGYGTNGGSVTGINLDDQRVAELPGVAPARGRAHTLRAYRSDRFARWGLDGTYRLTVPLREAGTAAARDRVGLYTWGGTLRVGRVVIWAGTPAP